MSLLAIHPTPGTYSDRWIEYCESKGIAYKRVNCLAEDIIDQCRDTTGVLWNWIHDNPREKLGARQVIAGLEALGLPVFPNLNTCSHYDDKIAQKYLLEAIGAPLIPTHVFFSEPEALEWVKRASWPKVFKLRCGAGSAGVRLVRSRVAAERICRTAFGRGFPGVGGYLSDFSTKMRKTGSWRVFWDKARRAPRTIRAKLIQRSATPRERGYVYFQDFLPDNAFDTRVTIIGERAFGFIRLNRPSDFRASGSGKIEYGRARVDPRCVQIAFDVAHQLGAQSLAFDFLFASDQNPMIGEISYCYLASAVHACDGHWDPAGYWHAGNVWPQDAILEDLLAATAANSKPERKPLMDNSGFSC